MWREKWLTNSLYMFFILLMAPFYTPHVKIVELWLDSLISLVLILLLHQQFSQVIISILWISLSHFHRIFLYLYFILLLMNFIWWDNFIDVNIHFPDFDYFNQFSNMFRTKVTCVQHRWNGLKLYSSLFWYCLPLH